MPHPSNKIFTDKGHHQLSRYSFEPGKDYTLEESARLMEMPINRLKRLIKGYGVHQVGIGALGKDLNKLQAKEKLRWNGMSEESLWRRIESKIRKFKRVPYIWQFHKFNNTKEK